MKLKALGIIIAIAVPLTMLSVLPVHAIGFVPNLLMSDRVFDNVSSMNATQIDAFLNQFGTSCISSNNGFSSPDIMGYSITSHSFIYGSNVSAGKVIDHAAEAYGINPQVLLATLQKEQSLVTGSVGCHPNVPDLNNTFLCNIDAAHPNNACTTGCPYSGGCINIAAGYYCPLNCLASKEGFTTQVIWAAWVLRFDEQRSEGNVGWNIQKTTTVDSSGNSWITSWNNSDDPPFPYSGFMTTGNFALYQGGPVGPYDGYATPITDLSNNIVSVHMDSGATAALYTYTPHETGNQNFVNIFTNWFGPTYGDLVRVQGGGVYKLEDVAGNITKRAFPSEIVFLSYSYNWANVVTISSTAMNLIPDGVVATMPYNVHFRDGHLVSSPIGGLYVVDSGLKRAFPNEVTFYSYGYKLTDALVISNAELSLIPDGTAMPFNAHHYDGHLVASSTMGIYVIDNGLKRPFPNEVTFYSYGYKFSDALVISSAEITLIPGGTAMPFNAHHWDGHLVTSQAGGIYVIDNGTRRPFANQETFFSYSYKFSDALVISSAEITLIPDGVAMPYNVHFRDGKLVQSSSGGGVYYIDNGTKRSFPNEATFFSYSYTWAQVINITPTEMSLIPDGPVMPLKI